MCRTSVANDRSRRLHASCREGIAVLVCQLAVGICAEEAVGEFSFGYACKKCFDAVIKYQAKKKAFVAQRRIQDFWKGGSNNYIHKRGWVLEGACPLP